MLCSMQVDQQELELPVSQGSSFLPAGLHKVGTVWGILLLEHFLEAGS